MTRERGEQGEGGAVCKVCGGRGWVLEVGYGAGQARPCRCSTARPIAERLASAGVWEAYRHCTREAWRGAWPEAQLKGFGRTRYLCTVLGPAVYSS